MDEKEFTVAADAELARIEAALERASDSGPAEFDFDNFAEVVRISTRMLDNVLDATHWPLGPQ